MTVPTERQKQAKVLRIFRKIHRTTGALLFIFFFVVSVTGLLLGWKKNSNGLLLSKSHTGTSTDFKNWLSIDSLHTLASQYIIDSISTPMSLELERIDIRKDKGMVKFVFVENYVGLQLDGSTGKILHVEKRTADLIENIHDGSLVDKILQTGKGQFKLMYTTIMGLALLIFTITGFWLWYGPKRMRNV